MHCKVVEFGERCYDYVPKTLRAKLDRRWRLDVYRGMSASSNEQYFGAWNGDVVKSRSVAVSRRSRNGARHMSRSSVVIRLAEKPMVQLTMRMSRTPIARTKSLMTTRNVRQRSTRATRPKIQWRRRKTTLTSAYVSVKPI